VVGFFLPYQNFHSLAVFDLRPQDFLLFSNLCTYTYTYPILPHPQECRLFYIDISIPSPNFLSCSIRFTSFYRRVNVNMNF